MDPHASLQKSKGLPKTVKAHKVLTVATQLQLFNKVDLETVMKASRWSSGGTFTSFYLSDLCIQADCIRKTDPVVATERSWLSPHPPRLLTLFTLIAVSLVVPTGSQSLFRKGGGVSEGPPTRLQLVRRFSICGSLIAIAA